MLPRMALQPLCVIRARYRVPWAMSTELELTRKFDISTDDPVRVGDPDAWSILVVTATTGVYSVQIVPEDTDITPPAPVEFDRQGAETEAQIVAALAALITARAAAETNDSPQGDLHEYVEQATSTGDELLVVVRQGAPKHRVTSTPPGGTADVSPDSIFPLTVYMVLDTEGHHVTEVEIVVAALDVEGEAVAGQGFYDVEVRRVWEFQAAQVSVLVEKHIANGLGDSFRAPFNGGRLAVALSSIAPPLGTDSVSVVARPVLGSGLKSTVGTIADSLSFNQADMTASIAQTERGGRWRGHQVFAELPNVGVVEQTIQNQGGTTVLPTTAGTVTLVGGATDVFGAGTGAWVVQIRGVGAGFVGSPDPGEAWLDDFVPMNGAAPVVSNVPFLRVFEIRVVVAGTSQSNDGTITATVGGNLQVQIDPLRTLSRSSHVVVPLGWTGFTSFFNINWVAGQPVRMECVVQLGGVIFPGFRVTFATSADFPIGVTTFPEMSDLWCRAARIGGGGTDPFDVTLPFLVRRNT